MVYSEKILIDLECFQHNLSIYKTNFMGEGRKPWNFLLIFLKKYSFFFLQCWHSSHSSHFLLSTPLQEGAISMASYPHKKLKSCQRKKQWDTLAINKWWHSKMLKLISTAWYVLRLWNRYIELWIYLKYGRYHVRKWVFVYLFNNYVVEKLRYSWAVDYGVNK